MERQIWAACQSGENIYLKREVNHQRDEQGLQYARKAMILTGMARNTNRLWEVTQLTPHLQAIVQKHKNVFDAARTGSINQQ